jgi:hypothetical protein
LYAQRSRTHRQLGRTCPAKPTLLAGYAKVRAPEKAFAQILQFWKARKKSNGVRKMARVQHVYESLEVTDRNAADS